MGPQDASDRIWLKQSVQFSVAGQVRTIEIALPVRPGASAEEIERLLRQADAGLEQMTQHLDNKVNELLGQAKTPAPPGVASPPRRPTRPLDSDPAAPAERARGGGFSANASPQASLTGTTSGGAEWPAFASADAGPSLDRKQFIAEIAVLGLNPNTAMKRLGLHSLEGVNLRQALEQLRRQLLQERPPATGGYADEAEDSGGGASSGPPVTGAPPPRSSPPSRRPPPEMKQRSLLSQAAPAEQTMLHPVLEGDLLLADEEQPLTDGAAARERREPLRLREQGTMPIPIRGARTLTALQEQVQAQTLLEKLRRIRGRLNPPSSDNLKAFRHVVEEQIGPEKTAALLQAVWNVSLPDQLNPEQIAECIRWGKDDHFEDEVDLLLKLTAPEES